MARAPVLKVEKVAIDLLKPDPENERHHPEHQLALLEASLQKFGQRKPLVVTADYTVVAGNGTLEAARRLGLKSLAVTVLPFDDPAEVRAFAIADNRSADLSTWDTDILLNSLRSLTDTDLLAVTGFDPDDMSDLVDLQGRPFETMKVRVEDLHAHPRNYHAHPPDQIEHLISSIKLNGFYRNVVVARDNTILAGHGVVAAATEMGLARVPVIRLDIDPEDPRALKVLTSDNEISNLAERDDRALTELLRDIMRESDNGLEGTGFNAEQLAALAMTTRPTSELQDINAAAEWVGMPGFEPIEIPFSLVISFANQEDREKFAETYGIEILKRQTRAWSTWWPYRERRDLASLKFE